MSIATVSALSMARYTRNNVRLMQSEMQTLQLEMSNGLKVDIAGSNGSRTASLLELRNVRNEVAQFKDNLVGQSTRLSLMQDALDEVRKSTEEVRNLALTASGTSSDIANATIAEAAQNAMKTVVNMLNSSQSGRFLFAGTKFDQQPLVQPDAVGPSGVTPTQAVSDVITSAGGLASLTTAADVDALIDGPGGLAELFSAANYGDNFFNGSTTPVVGRVEGDITIAYEATAGDQPVRDIMQGLYMLAAVPSDSVTPAAYQQLAKRSWELLERGLGGVVNTQGILGQSEQTVKAAQDRLAVQDTLVSKQIVKMEEADIYTTSLRLDTLKTQLEATFKVTASLQGLSLINYL